MFFNNSCTLFLFVYLYDHSATKLSNPHVLFCAEDVNDTHLEVIPRPNNDVYVCGLGGSLHLDEDGIAETTPEKVVPNPKRVNACHKSLTGLSNTITSDGDTEPR